MCLFVAVQCLFCALDNRLGVMCDVVCLRLVSLLFNWFVNVVVVCFVMIYCLYIYICVCICVVSVCY